MFPSGRTRWPARSGNLHGPHHFRSSRWPQQGKWTEAIPHYEQALQLNPNYAEAHYNLGVALAQQGQWPEAIPHFERALQLKPDYAEAHYNLGVALAQQGQWPAAIPHFERALQLKPDYAEAHYNLGLALANKGSGRQPFPTSSGRSNSSRMTPRPTII